MLLTRKPPLLRLFQRRHLQSFLQRRRHRRALSYSVHLNCMPRRRPLKLQFPTLDYLFIRVVFRPSLSQRQFHVRLAASAGVLVKRQPKNALSVTAVFTNLAVPVLSQFVLPCTIVLLALRKARKDAPNTNTRQVTLNGIQCWQTERSTHTALNHLNLFLAFVVRENAVTLWDLVADKRTDIWMPSVQVARVNCTRNARRCISCANMANLNIVLVASRLLFPS